MDYYTVIKQMYPDIEDSEFNIRDDGQGPYIEFWTYTNADVPDLSDIEDSARLQSELNEINLKRKAEYGRIEDQLDMIYHQGLDAWKQHITTVKQSNPK